MICLHASTLLPGTREVHGLLCCARVGMGMDHVPRGDSYSGPLTKKQYSIPQCRCRSGQWRITTGEWSGPRSNVFGEDGGDRIRSHEGLCASLHEAGFPSVLTRCVISLHTTISPTSVKG